MVVQRGRVNFAHFDSKPMMDVQSLLAQISGLSFR
jgi:hypothetical protein